MIRNAVQHSENLSNSLGLNYKSAALNQLSYAGIPPTKAVFSAARARMQPEVPFEMKVIRYLHAKRWMRALGRKTEQRKNTT